MLPDKPPGPNGELAPVARGNDASSANKPDAANNRTGSPSARRVPRANIFRPGAAAPIYSRTTRNPQLRRAVVPNGSAKLPPVVLHATRLAFPYRSFRPSDGRPSYLSRRFRWIHTCIHTERSRPKLTVFAKIEVRSRNSRVLLPRSAQILNLRLCTSATPSRNSPCRGVGA